MEPTEAIKEAILRLVEAWNSRNELAFGALFTEEARYIGTDGILRQGRARIGDMLREQGPRSRVSIERPISVDVLGSRASAKFRWTSVPKEQGRAGVINCVLVMESDCWRIDELVNGATPV